MVSAGSSAVTSMSRASRSLTARAYSARLRRWKLRDPGTGVRAASASIRRLEGRRHVGQRRPVGALGASRRHHLGAQLADHLLGQLAIVEQPGGVEGGQRQATGLAALAVAGGAVLLHGGGVRGGVEGRRAPASWSAAAPAAPRRGLPVTVRATPGPRRPARRGARERLPRAPARRRTTPVWRLTIAVGSATCTNLGIRDSSPRRRSSDRAA